MTKHILAVIGLLALTYPAQAQNVISPTPAALLSLGHGVSIAERIARVVRAERKPRRGGARVGADAARGPQQTAHERQGSYGPRSGLARSTFV